MVAIQNYAAAPAAKALARRRAFRDLHLLIGVSLRAVRSAVAISIFSLAIPTLAQAAPAPTTPKIGGIVVDPSTGQVHTIRAVFDGAVLTDSGLLVITDPTVGALVPDPTDGAKTVAVTAVHVNATTSLVDQLTLSDGRVIDVARDVSGQFLPAVPTTPAAGSAPAPLPMPSIGSGNNYASSITASAGADGANQGVYFDLIPPFAHYVSPANGATGGSGGAATVSLDSDITTTGSTPAIRLARTGGTGGKGGSLTIAVVGTAADGGNGGTPATINLTSSGTLATADPYAYGIYVTSKGGAGGAGGDVTIAGVATGGDGGAGGNGGIVNVSTLASSNITTYGTGAIGILGQSLAGTPGDGGYANGAGATGGSGGAGGNGGTVQISNSGAIFTFGNGAHGVLGQSIGGAGGDAGSSGGIVSLGGRAPPAATAGRSP